MRTRSLSIVAFLLILCLNVSFASAQSVSFAGVQTTVGGGLNNPQGVAVDAAGDVFISVTGNSQVVEVPANGGPQITVGSGLSYPRGLAVDLAGDLFIADQGNNRVVEVPAGGGAQFTVGSGISSPMGVGVDATGDVFIADSGNNRVVEVPAGGGLQFTVGSGLNTPYDTAVDAAGDLFIADAGNNRVVEIPAGGPQTTIGSGLDHPDGVAVDAAGNLFIADAYSGRVLEVPAGGGAQTTVPTSGVYNPVGLAVDGAGDVFLADYANNRVLEVQRVAVNFGDINVCPGEQATPAPCNQTLALNYNVTASTTFGTINVYTQGASNLDFALSSSGCIGTQSAGSTCTVNVTFTPLAPGLRMGAVQLTDNLGNLLVTTMVRGQGQGPAIAFGPGGQITVPASGLVNPYCVAVDGKGDVFVSDPGNQRVVEVPAGGGPQITVGSGLIGPFGLAVDGAGDVFITDIGLNQVVVVPAGGGPQTTVGSGLSSPYGVTVDGAGDVFIADSGNSRVVEVPAGGGPQTTVGSGLYPYGVAVDGAGDIFIADRPAGDNRVVEIPIGGGPQITVVSGLYNPSGVAVDGAGDVFVADFDYSRVLEVPYLGNGMYGPPTAVGIGISYPFDMALDGLGNVFIVDWGNSRVVEVQRAQPPTFSFASTQIGRTSSDSPQWLTVQNIGNQALNAVTPGLIVGANFLQVAGSGTPADCTGSFSLTPGETCNLSISFEPQSVGSIVSAATFTDNALNAAANSTSAGQSVTLQGTATQESQAIAFGALSNQALGSAPFMLSASASSGLAVSFASNTPAVCTLSSATVTLAAVGTCAIQAMQAGNANYAAAASVTQSFQISDFTLSSNPTASTVIAGQTGTFTLTATPQGSFTNAISLSCSGLPVLAGCTFTSTTLTPNASTVTTTLKITTTAHTAALAAPPFGHHSGPLYSIWLILPAMLLGTVGMAAPKGRKLASCCLAFLLVGGCLLQVACGGAGLNSATGTPAGTYSVIVTGAAGSTQHTSTIMLTVQ
jgi:sugar lactone lactonase YvrE